MIATIVTALGLAWAGGIVGLAIIADRVDSERARRWPGPR